MRAMPEGMEMGPRTLNRLPSLAPGQLSPSLLPEVILDLLSLGHGVRFRAKGGSMQPTIREGEVITVAPVKPRDVKQRDVILYRNKGRVVVHRVARIRRKEGNRVLFITRGDGSCSCDAPVESHQILGAVVSVQRNGRSIDLVSKRSKILTKAMLTAFRLKRLVFTRVLANRFAENQEVQKAIRS